MLVFSIQHNGTVGKELAKLLRIPVDHYNNVLTLLQLTSYGELIRALDYRGRAQACAYVAQVGCLRVILYAVLRFVR